MTDGLTMDAKKLLPLLFFLFFSLPFIVSFIFDLIIYLSLLLPYLFYYLSSRPRSILLFLQAFRLRLCIVKEAVFS